MSNPYRLFREELLRRDPSIRHVNTFVLPDKDLEPKSEIHVWLCRRGVFYVQVWLENGGFELAIPTFKHLTSSCVEEVVRYASTDPREMDAWDEFHHQAVKYCADHGLTDMDAFVIWNLGIGAFKYAKQLGAQFPHEEGGAK